MVRPVATNATSVGHPIPSLRSFAGQGYGLRAGSAIVGDGERTGESTSGRRSELDRYRATGAGGQTAGARRTAVGRERKSRSRHRDRGKGQGVRGERAAAQVLDGYGLRGAAAVGDGAKAHRA